MDIRHLKYFAALIDAGSFVAAARILGISQPSLSARIKEVEVWAGRPLFRRHARGVSLTQAGETLLPHARQILEILEKAEREIWGSAETIISLGVSPTPAMCLVPQLVESLRTSSAMRVRVHVSEQSSDELIQLLTVGRLDAAICYQAGGSTLVSVPLCEEDLALVGATNVVDTAAGEIDFEQLVQYRLVLDTFQHATRRKIEDLASSKNLRFGERQEIVSTHLRRVLMEQQQFCAVVSRALYSEEIRSGLFGYRRIVNPTLSITLFLNVSSSMKQSSFIDLLSIVRQLVRNNIDLGNLGWRACRLESGV